MFPMRRVGEVQVFFIADAASAASAWVQGAQAKQQKFVDGVQNTPKDPTALAIAQESALLSNFTQSVTSGRWRRGLQRAGKTTWQAMTLAKAANYGMGVAAAESKYQSAMSTWLPFMGTVQGQIASMPKGTLANSIARSTAWQTALYNKKRTG